MTHWLEDIERKNGQKDSSASKSARTEDKIFRIGKNYEANKEAYDSFILKMTDLVGRVNTIPMEHRQEFGQIKGKAKNNRLKNHLYCYSSSRRVIKREFRGILSPFRSVHYKHIRMVCLSVSKVMGKVTVEVEEKYLEKKRKDGKIIKVGDEKNNKRGRGMGKVFHEVYHYDMNKLSEGFALNIIDWLAFREEVSHLTVVREGESRKKSHQ